MAKPRFTFEDHKKAGAELRLVYNGLSAVVGRVVDAYPKATKEVTAGHKAVEALKLFISTMDDAVSRENPEADNLDVIHCYFPDDPKPE